MFSLMIRKAPATISANQLRCFSSAILNTNLGQINSVQNDCRLSTNSNLPKTTYNVLNKYQTLPALTTIKNIHLTPTRMGAVDHSRLWTIERLLAVSLLTTLPLAVIAPNPVLDTVASISIVMHQYWGLEAICHDYIRPIIFGNFVPKIVYALLVTFTLTTLGGLFYFNYNDVGLGRAIRRFWTIGKTEQQQQP